MAEREIRKKLAQLAADSIPNLYTVTGGMGLEFGKNKRFFEKAKIAAQNNDIVKDKNIYWVPLTINKKVLVVCGVKSSRKPLEEIKLLNGLAAELQYGEFLKEQVDKYIDNKSDFIKKLLETTDIRSFDQAIDKGDILGINLRAPQAVILIKTPGLFKNIHANYKKLTGQALYEKMTKECNAIIKKISLAFNNYDQNITVCIKPDTFILLKWADGKINTLNTIKFFKEKGEYIRKVVEDITETTVTTGVGQYYPGLTGLRKSYDDAKIALEIGTRIWGEGKTYHITDIGMFISLSPKISFNRKCELANQILGDILLDQDLNKTVRAFLDNNMNLTDAAKKLHLHRNTLIYRLEQIKKQVGLDPRNFTDAVQIKLGLTLFSSENNCQKRH